MSRVLLINQPQVFARLVQSLFFFDVEVILGDSVGESLAVVFLGLQLLGQLDTLGVVGVVQVGDGLFQFADEGVEVGDGLVFLSFFVGEGGVERVLEGVQLRNDVFQRLLGKGRSHLHQRQNRVALSDLAQLQKSLFSAFRLDRRKSVHNQLQSLQNLQSRDLPLVVSFVVPLSRLVVSLKSRSVHVQLLFDVQKTRMERGNIGF